MVIVWQYRCKRDHGLKRLERVKKAAGYFIFFSSISLWFTGVGKLINDIFQSDIIPLIKPDL